MNQNSDNLLEHAWRYFELHANQRIILFNYFLVVSGALSAGLATALQGSQRFSSLGIALGILLIVISFIFWKLDQRASHLIKHAESVIADLEQNSPNKKAHIFRLELKKSEDVLIKDYWWSRHWTYGSSFRFIFITMALFGGAGIALSTLKFIGIISW